MDIQNSKEKEVLSSNVLVSGNLKYYVSLFQTVIFLLEKCLNEWVYAIINQMHNLFVI